MIVRRFLAVAGLMWLALGSLALGGCSSGMSRYTHESGLPAPSRSAYHQDGTIEHTGSVRRTARRAPVANEARAEDVSTTTGTRAAPREQGALKPYSQEWWDNENSQDARIKQKMNICRGC